jgi:hypothetical protein
MRRYVFRLAILSLAAIGPSLARGDDQQIAQQIIEKLKAEKDAGTLKGFSIDLQVDEGTVWLSGRVASSQQQARALDLARRIAGVKQVVDDLTVAQPAAKPTPARPSPSVARTAAPRSESQAAPAAPTGPMQVITAEPVPINPPAQEAAVQPAAMSPSPATTANQAAMVHRPSSPAHNSVLNSVSKTLVSAVHGGRTLGEPHPAAEPRMNTVNASPIQPASVSSEVAAATGANAGPIGSGVEPGAASSRRSVVQAAQPIANVPQQVATADDLQPLNPGMPQMQPMPQYAMMPMQVPYMIPVYAGSQMQVPLAMGQARPANYAAMAGGPVPDGAAGPPVPMYMPGSGVGIAPARYDHPNMPGYAWPSYAAAPNYAAVTYPKQYSPTAWPYIGPFYPYPQVPLGWRKVTLEWDDGWWMLDFKDRRTMYNH